MSLINDFAQSEMKREYGCRGIVKDLLHREGGKESKEGKGRGAYRQQVQIFRERVHCVLW